MKYNYLEGLRGYMAIWVFLYHATGFLPHINSQNILFKTFTSAFLPVLVFIILSGFVTHILLQKNENYFFYIKRRAYRLFPIYLVCFVISLIMLKFSLNTLINIPFENSMIKERINLINIYYNTDKTLNVFSHLTLTHGLFPQGKFPFSYTIMGQAWSLTLEWQFYILIPFLYFFLNKKDIFRHLIILLGLILIIIFFNINNMNQNSFLLSNMILYFLIGYFSLPLFNKYQSSNDKSIFIFLGISSVFFYFFKDLNISFIILIWALVLYFQKNKNKLTDFIFSSKIPLFLGKISYSVYCIHMIVLFLLTAFLQSINIASGFYFCVLLLIGGLFLTLLISNYTYKYIELYFINLAKK
jgi:peptidoglycan/LPS O-acetylase OafA/YrhL